MDLQAVFPWRRRRDLQIKSVLRNGLRYWHVKDPVGLAYYELSEEEYFLLNQLDQPVSMADLSLRFHERFRPQTLDPAELVRFLGQLVQQGLLLAEQFGYGRLLAARMAQRDRSRLWARCFNILAIRFRGFDPDRLLAHILARCGWLFSRWTLSAAMLLIAAAIVLVTVQFEGLIARLPEARAMLSSRNILLMAGLLGGVKVLHEFGHGLACKKFGGECHEMGFMLLVFTPCLYCNVSDIWMLNSKWQRAAVSAAGILIEATIAAACTFLWWFSEPGLFHSICLNLMFVCSISTVLFNGNPLLRYDGYFILSDLLELPNLQQRAVAAVRGVLAKFYLGLELPPLRHSTGTELALIVYGAASSVYRLFLTVSILWLMHSWLVPYGMTPFVQIFAALVLTMTLVLPMTQLWNWCRQSQQRSEIGWRRFAVRAGLTVLAIGGLVVTPLPARVTTVALYEMRDAAPVFVTAEGTLSFAVHAGTNVASQQLVAQLVDPELERELARLQSDVDEHRVRLDQLERRRVQDSTVAAQIPIVREALHDRQLQLERRKQDGERLTLRAPRPGTIVAPAMLRRTVGSHLSSWSGTPLDDRNRGCFLRTGTMVCFVGDPADLTATLIVNQDDFPLVRAGQSVQLVTPAAAGEIVEGTIVDLSALDLDQIPPELIRRSELPTQVTVGGQVRPIGIWYQARVKLENHFTALIPGMVSEARIVVEPQSLAARFRRWMGRTFAFSQTLIR